MFNPINFNAAQPAQNKYFTAGQKVFANNAPVTQPLFGTPNADKKEGVEFSTTPKNEALNNDGKAYDELNRLIKEEKVENGQRIVIEYLYNEDITFRETTKYNPNGLTYKTVEISKKDGQYFKFLETSSFVDDGCKYEGLTSFSKSGEKTIRLTVTDASDGSILVKTASKYDSANILVEEKSSQYYPTDKLKEEKSSKYYPNGKLKEETISKYYSVGDQEEGELKSSSYKEWDKDERLIKDETTENGKRTTIEHNADGSEKTTYATKGEDGEYHQSLESTISPKTITQNEDGTTTIKYTETTILIEDKTPYIEEYTIHKDKDGDIISTTCEYETDYWFHKKTTTNNPEVLLQKKP